MTTCQSPPYPPEQIPTLELVIKPGTTIRFTTMLQSGFVVELKPGQTIRQLLRTLPGFTDSYLEKRVQTIFLNSIPADSVDLELPDGAILALSAAMPGLAGAIFRRGGRHRTLRSQPEPPDSASNPGPENRGRCTVKLFNHIARERGETLLSRGVILPGPALRNFLDRQGENLESLVRQCILDGNPVTTSDLRRLQVPLIRVRTREENAPE
ncbi:hypothetical protein [Desulfolithobacter sp.]